MNVEDLIGYSFAFLILFVPLLGLTARLAIKPMIDAIVRLRAGFIQVRGGGVVERRILQLEEEVQLLRRPVRRPTDIEAFRRESSPLPSGLVYTVTDTVLERLPGPLRICSFMSESTVSSNSFSVPGALPQRSVSLRGCSRSPPFDPPSVGTMQDCPKRALALPASRSVHQATSRPQRIDRSVVMATRQRSLSRRRS